MKYEKHDFLKNLEAAIKAGDNETVMAIVTSEVAELMSKNKLALVRAVKKSGKQIPDNISDKELADIISSGLVNQYGLFIKNLIETIHAEKAKYSNFVGEIVQGVGSFVQGIGGAVGAGLQARAQTTAAREGTKQSQIALQAEKAKISSGILANKTALDLAKIQAETEKAKAGSTTKTVVIASLVVAGIAVVGIVGYILYKRNQTPTGNA